MSAISNPEPPPSIVQARQYAIGSARRLLAAFERVPDDKITWSPTPTCRSALQIAAHCACANGILAKALRSGMRDMPRSPEHGTEITRAFESAVTNRVQAIAVLEQSMDDVLSALGAVTEEQLAAAPETPFGAHPMAFWIMMPGSHMMGHTAQIEYLQTTWGDLCNHG